MAQVETWASRDRPSAESAAEALHLAHRLPRLVLEARRVSSTLAGSHGRRKAGLGDGFWQFRPFEPTESARQIDWRRSAREDRLSVREREWDAAQSVFLWIDRSSSMQFSSSLSPASKADRALVLGLALAETLAAAGERVGLLGLSHPRTTRCMVEALAQTLAADTAGREAKTPPAIPLPPRSQVILITDALLSPQELGTSLSTLAVQGAKGHMIRVVDPTEEGFPFSGHLVLEENRLGLNREIGDADAWRISYRQRFAAHGNSIAQVCKSQGWSVDVHHTDKPATLAALQALSRLSGRSSAYNAREHRSRA